MRKDICKTLSFIVALLLCYAFFINIADITTILNSSSTIWYKTSYIVGNICIGALAYLAIKYSLKG